MNVSFKNKRGLPGGPNEKNIRGSISIQGFSRYSPDINNDFKMLKLSITLDKCNLTFVSTSFKN